VKFGVFAYYEKITRYKTMITTYWDNAPLKLAGVSDVLTASFIRAMK
jgi:hypothetical protein